MADDLFGWELTYKSVENQLRRKEDFLIALTHWYIIKNGFFCIGTSNAKSSKEKEVKSETLPSGWNEFEDYNIRYSHSDNIYLLKGSVTDGDLILNFLRAEDLVISSCIFSIDKTVKQINGDINISIPDYKNVLSILRNDLIGPVFVRTTHSAAGTQTTTEKNKPSPNSNKQDPFSPDATDIINDPLGVPTRRPPPLPTLDPMWNNPLRDPTAVGRNDLDPFSQGMGGGMIFDPLNPRTDRNLDPTIPGPSRPLALFRGPVPPGARFDPFGPPGSGRDGSRRIDPDPDHLPPPGYDDMFISSGPPDPSLNPRNRRRGRGDTDPSPPLPPPPPPPPPPGSNDPYM